MKKKLLILILATSLNASHSYSQDTTLTYLSGLNLLPHNNKPIDSFLLELPINYLSMKIMSKDNPKYARILAVTYSDKVTVYIYAHNFRHMNPRSETFTWNMTLFKKEDIHHIEVWKAVDCYNGCPPGVLTAQ
jgi:hypothetical protein